jgi:hypothetical protein
MLDDLLHWRTLTAAINQLPAQPSFLLDRVFSAGGPRASDIIDIDLIAGSDKLVPFVTDVEGGVVVERTTREMRSFKAPRLRVKKHLSARELLLERPAGGDIYLAGGGDINRARQAAVRLELQDLRNRLQLTTEWMCAQALTGALTVSQDNIAFQIDYRFPATHKVTLSGDARWGEASADIPGNLQDWADRIFSVTKKPANMLLLGSTAARKFESDAKVKDDLDRRNYNAGSLAPEVGNNYLGVYRGLEVWRYPFEYTTGSGAKTKLIGDNVAIMLTLQAEFSMEYGLILDLKAGAQVVGRFFAKSWTTEDPSTQWLLAESRPLPVVREIGSVVYAQVC